MPAVAADTPRDDAERQVYPASRGIRRRVEAVGRRHSKAIALLAVLLFLVGIPILTLLISSVRPTGLPSDPGFSLQNFRDVLTSPSLPRVALNTLIYAGGSAVSALAVAFGLAWAVQRTNVYGGRIFSRGIVIPIAFPPFLLAIAWVLLLDPNVGPVNDAVEALIGRRPFSGYNLGSMIFVEALSLVPSAFLILAPGIANLNPTLEEAAATSGASRPRAFFRVSMPLLRPAISACAIYLFIAAIVSFDVAGIIGMPSNIPVASTQIYLWHGGTVSGLPEYGKISVLALMVMLLVIPFVWAYQRGLRVGDRFATIAGKPSHKARTALGPWRVPVTVAVLSFFVMSVIVPLGMLAWTSLLPYQQGFSIEALSALSMDNYERLVAGGNFARYAGHSVVIAAVAVVGVLALCLWIAHFITRTKHPARGLVDTLSFLPLGIPGVIIGTALTYVYLSFSALPIYGSIWIIAIAHMTMYIAYGSRAMRGAYMQLGGELEEAARTSGAGHARTMRRITLPLLSPAIVALALWVLTHSLRELTTAVLLQSGRNGTFTTLMWEAWTSGEAGVTGAAAVLLVVPLIVVMLAVAIIGQFGRRANHVV